MKKRLLPITAAILLAGMAFSQTGIGTTTPDPSAVLEVASTTQGFLPPRMDGVQRDAIAGPAKGLMLYNLTQDCLQINKGTPLAPEWICISGGGDGQVATLDCGGALTGTFTAGQASSGTKTINYTGGNGGTYSISAASMNVTGLTAMGSGTLDGTSLTLAISGTPSGPGTASFTVDIGGVGCPFSVTVADPPPPPPLPGGIVLTAGQQHIIASVLDSDYLPYAAPTGPATTAPQAADGTPEGMVIDVQGTLGTTGTTISIPYTVSGSDVMLPGFTQTVSVPGDLVEGGTPWQVTLSYDPQSLAVGSGSITATLKAESGTLNARKLDVNSGVGSDYKGVPMAEFTIATDGSGGTGTIQLRDMAGIPDRAFGDGAHNFLYLPVVSSTDKIWLNNNLGANYNNMHHSAFDPKSQGGSATDINAYGSLYQWGRSSDGHELIDWDGELTGTLSPPQPVNGTDPTPTDNPGHGDFIIGALDWRQNPDDDLWNGASAGNNPCPQGFHVPNETDLTAEFTAYGITNMTNAYASDHKFVLTGFRHYTTASLTNQGSSGYLWTGTVSGNGARYRYFDSIGTNVFDGYRAYGFPVRCLQD